MANKLEKNYFIKKILKKQSINLNIDTNQFTLLLFDYIGNRFSTFIFLD